MSKTESAYSIIMGRALKSDIRTIKGLADQCGFIRQTLSNKLSRPRTMTCGDLYEIANEIHLDDAEIADFVRSCGR